MAVKIGEQDTGSVVYQATEESLLKSNIYCEIPYCSADSRTFVYERTNPASEPNRIEYVICEFGTWETQVGGCGLSGPAITHEGMLYFRRMAGEVAQELVRLNLSTGASEVIHDFPEGLKPVGLGTMSPGERYFAYGVAISYSPKMFGIELLDLNAGTREIINTDPDICNPHTQFEPSEGKQVMVQHNRGCEFRPDGTRVKLVGEEGATEYLLDIPDGKVTRLQVGKPHTTPITGHESWIGNTEEILLSVGTDGDFAPEKGNLLAVRSGSPARVASRGYTFSHVGTSVCGRFFCCDDHPSGDVIVGSIRTGKNAVVCHSESSFAWGDQNTHPHAYLSPDLKWTVFNSDRSGEPQVHAATIPDGMLEELERA